MILINLPDSLHTTLVERLQQSIERILVGEIMCDGLVHELISEDRGFVLIAPGNLAPDVTEQLLTLLTLEQPRIAMPVVDIITRLSTGTVVHVEDQIQIVGLAPADHRINALITILLTRLSHIVLVGEELIVERQPNGICALTGDEIDISTGHVVILESLPERCREVWSHSLLEHQVYHPGRIGATKPEHIAFRIEPVTQVCTLNKELFAIRFDQVMPFYGYKSRIAFLSAASSTSSKQKHDEV